MIIGVLGKGGSGKSTIATRLAHFLCAEGRNVLAIDGDHNMDFSYNLGVQDTFLYLGGAMQDVRDIMRLGNNEHYQEIFLCDIATRFTLTPPDVFTEKFSHKITSRLRVMASGPHTSSVLHGEHCSHSLSTPLKIYLPLLSLSDTDGVIVDEKAGVDSVTTGIPTGFTIALIVAEPREHSVRVANQIAHALDFYGVPYEFIGNKIKDVSDFEYVRKGLVCPPLCVFKASIPCIYEWESLYEEDKMQFRNLYTRIKEEPDCRLERTREKFKRNAEYQKSHV